MQNFVLFYKIIRATMITSLPQPVEFDTLESINLVLAQGQLGEEVVEWRIDKEANAEAPSSIFVTAANYDYFFIDAQGEKIVEPGLDARELIADFEATLHWMVINSHLYGDKGHYVVLEKCLRTLSPEIVLSV
ncbi:hypothetical protein [Hafnia psychrotolerans]|jgi:hypothetical protein|uniref:Uncharacterized protein n=1 Tax=Hafnia psychrotolerans TaxID=1477018 RepID=A0ABQ1GCU8_9GAMM|nr:hypothetical protein [Hafnia psychrotolerans]GGA41293.1 hypothetical protein GCM10011328_15310 [Hafnia psychrotolerans]